MKNKRSNKGISLISLTVAVIILIMLTGMLVYNAKNGIKIRNLTKMQNDIEALNDKVHAYYVKHGAIPAEVKFEQDYVKFYSAEKYPNDAVDEYYVLDLTAIEVLTLNYGADFSASATSYTAEQDDLYVINKQSHRIYYARGIVMDGITYYTTNDVDEEITLQEIPEDLGMEPEDLIGEYVNYNVEYTDGEYEYKSHNGWRIISAERRTDDQTAYDIEIISTGMPASLDYNVSITSAPWTGSDTDITNYLNEGFYGSDSNTNQNMYAVSGLYYNFELVELLGTSLGSYDANRGYYKKLKVDNVEITGDQNGSIFISSEFENKIDGIRSVTLADIIKTGAGKATSEDKAIESTETLTESEDKVLGLFKLDELSGSTNASTHGVEAYTYSVGSYWVASPDSSSGYPMRVVDYAGNISSSYHMYEGVNLIGLRPVISISNVKFIEEVNGAWIIE